MTDTEELVGLSYPAWLDDTHMDPSWIQEATKLVGITSCHVTDVSNKGRKGTSSVQQGATLKLDLTTRTSRDDDGGIEEGLTTLIVKQVPDQGRVLSRQLGLAREALFYKNFVSQLPPNSVPKIYFSYGKMETGEKCVIMQDLSSADYYLDSSVLFGPGNPHNWHRDLAAGKARAGSRVTAERVALTTFRTMAHIHAQFWKSEKLLQDENRWLRGQQWLRGQGRETWEASQALVQQSWSTANHDIIQWDPLLKKVAAKAVSGISWEAQQERLHMTNSHWTLVHGDFWPGNVMWKIDDKTVRLLDWEMCGLGSGPQDLGQYVISNMDPTERRACEKHLIQAYYEVLRNAGIDVTFEYCWREYTVGGLERWLWFLIYCLGQETFHDWAQFFHDQVASFMHDHGLTEQDITQPRP